MPRANEPVNTDQDQQYPEQQQQPEQIEKPKTEPKKDDTPLNGGPKSSVSTTKVNFNFTNDTLADENEMESLKGILQDNQEQQDEQLFVEDSILTVEEVARFLEGTYDVQGFFTYPDLWKRDKGFYLDIAEGITPQINQWAMRFPAVGHAVKTVSAAGSWGRLIWDHAFTYLKVNNRKKAELEAKKEAEQNGGTNYDYSNQQSNQQPNSTYQPTSMPTGGKFIVP